jgi:hypothetical protein
MPYAFTPPGYMPVLLGQAQDIEDLGAFTTLEEGAAEGTLVLMKLDFVEPPLEEVLVELEQACRNAGVEPWPGSEFYVYADISSKSVYLVWQKGFAWLPIIIGLLATMVLPPLLTAGLWLILPDSLKSFISGLINLGIMMLMMWLVMKMVPALSSEKAKPKQIKEAGE